MDESVFSDLKIVVDGTQIKSVRGQALPEGIVYSPVDANKVSTISATAMHAMSSARQWAQIAKNRARETAGD